MTIALSWSCVIMKSLSLHSCLQSPLFHNNKRFISLPLQEHFNFYAIDETLGPVVMSMKTEQISNQEHTRVLLRYVKVVTFDIPAA